MLQGALVTAMQGVAPHTQILSKNLNKWTNVHNPNLSNQSTLTDKRSSSHYTFNFTQLFWKTNTIWQIFQKHCLHSQWPWFSLPFNHTVARISANARSFIILQVMPLRPGHNISFSIGIKSLDLTLLWLSMYTYFMYTHFILKTIIQCLWCTLDGVF